MKNRTLMMALAILALSASNANAEKSNQLKPQPSKYMHVNKRNNQTFKLAKASSGPQAKIINIYTVLPKSQGLIHKASAKSTARKSSKKSGRKNKSNSFKKPYKVAFSAAVGFPTYSKVASGVYFNDPSKRILGAVELTMPRFFAPQVDLGLEAISYKARDSFSAPLTDTSVSLSGQAFFANVYYRPIRKSTPPKKSKKEQRAYQRLMQNIVADVFFGVGLGYAPNNVARYTTTLRMIDVPVSIRTTKGRMAYQVILGYQHAITPYMSWEAKLRYAMLGKYDDCCALDHDCSIGAYNNILFTLGLKTFL